MPKAKFCLTTEKSSVSNLILIDSPLVDLGEIYHTKNYHHALRGAQFNQTDGSVGDLNAGDFLVVTTWTWDETVPRPQ